MKGFNFSNENIPGIQYEVKDDDGKLKKVIVGADNDFRDYMELPKQITAAIKTSVATGEPSSFNFGGVTYSVYPELEKTSKGWEFKPLVQVGDQFILPETIYENAKNQAAEKLNKK